MLKRNDFRFVLEEVFGQLKELFARKNAAYGTADDLFWNFRLTAGRLFGTADHVAMYRVLYAYMDKHVSALANGGITDSEFVERHMDIILYSLLAIAMHDAYAYEQGQGQVCGCAQCGAQRSVSQQEIVFG